LQQGSSKKELVKNKNGRIWKGIKKRILGTSGRIKLIKEKFLKRLVINLRKRSQKRKKELKCNKEELPFQTFT